MASIIELLKSGSKEILTGEVTGRSGKLYTVNLRDRSVNVGSSLPEILALGTQVFVTDIENSLRIIAKADIKVRDRKEVVFNG